MNADHLARLFQELSAAPTRRDAEDLFFNYDWAFIKMPPDDREAVYARIDDIIKEKPE